MAKKRRHQKDSLVSHFTTKHEILFDPISVDSNPIGLLNFYPVTADDDFTELWEEAKKGHEIAIGLSSAFYPVLNDFSGLRPPPESIEGVLEQVVLQEELMAIGSLMPTIDDVAKAVVSFTVVKIPGEIKLR